MMMRRQKAGFAFAAQLATHTQRPRNRAKTKKQPDEARFALYGVAVSFDLLPISSADTLGSGGIGL